MTLPHAFVREHPKRAFLPSPSALASITAAVEVTPHENVKQPDENPPPFSDDLLKKVRAVDGVEVAVGGIFDQGSILGRNNKPIASHQLVQEKDERIAALEQQVEEQRHQAADLSARLARIEATLAP